MLTTTELLAELTKIRDLNHLLYNIQTAKKLAAEAIEKAGTVPAKFDAHDGYINQGKTRCLQYEMNGPVLDYTFHEDAEGNGEITSIRLAGYAYPKSVSDAVQKLLTDDDYKAMEAAGFEAIKREEGE